MGDAIMTNVIQQQNQLLTKKKQWIIQIDLGEDVDMDSVGITLRGTFFNNQDKDGNCLQDAIENTSTGGTYGLLFQ
jgi:hypothetical protein